MSGESFVQGPSRAHCGFAARPLFFTRVPKEAARPLQRLGLKAKEVHRLVDIEPPARNFSPIRFHRHSANGGRAGQDARQAVARMSAMPAVSPDRRDRSGP